MNFYMPDKGSGNTRIDFLCCFNAHFAGLFADLQ